MRSTMTWSCQTSTIRTATLPRPELSSMHVSFLGQSIIVNLYFSLCSWNPFCKEWFTKIQNKFTKVDFKQITFTRSPISCKDYHFMNSKMTSFSFCGSAWEYWNIQGNDSITDAFLKHVIIIFFQLSFIGNFLKCIFQKVLISRHGNMRDTVQVK